MLDIYHLVRCGIWAEEGDAHWTNSVPGRSAGDKIYKMLKWPRLVSRTLARGSVSFRGHNQR